MDPNAVTPRKQRRRNVKGESAVIEGHDDDEEEPTPRPHPLSALPLMSPTSIHRPLSTSSPSRTSTSSHSANIESTESRKRKRSTSPSKQRLELNQYAEYALQQRAWGRVDELPEEMRALAASMQLISKGRRVLSSEHAHWEQQVGSGIAEEDQLIFAKQGLREETGDVPDLSSVRRVLRRAERNAQCNCSEAAWNSGVHDFLLDMAHRGSRYTDGVLWENITTARIYPSNLLGTRPVCGGSSPERAESKRVDFCIALNMSTSLGKELTSKGILQLNHTDYGGTRYNPIAVSIETKAGAEAGADATLQLTTWVAAQDAFLRRVLEKLGRPNVTIPPLPLVMIQGHQWNFYYAQMKTDATTLWYGGDAFGNTSTLLGIYRIIAGLQRLMQWAETVYKPWFIENIVGPLLDS
ncbi:hypothetical protein CERZMDRAFT_89143 [Cercospora zeae-maydis SCOH1-5]|uniref:PD-(D/E)XK nuclease-like domain-containing protein n=1 Tax=Cercospora zeae-maydis SCOH1-5 TaxID=717836 RepID=A0A6A6F286_9PEZI|nr:hypothetical protein CERZMDRAFT_89143 [Cercospora zeae-maydis SCOH1-5]